MKPVWQTVVHVSTNTGDCLVESRRGNSYPVQLNNVPDVQVGDKALVSKAIDGSWIILRVKKENNSQHLDISDFPRDDDGNLNWIEYHKYLSIIERMREPERIRFDNHLREAFKGEVM